ncbi:hypothetical protein SSPO_004880 [Streptomyces antimycoticus]|uniref:Uncharacterized protein n=1 Tax=Streptomyces antimycoticus TaxID=68175 RepID=A0A499UDB2_9ACTN|nr:hypothetical protein SSPO_004880 [Streptomyces antimycoticus]
MAALFVMEVVPARVEALRSKAKRLVARGWLAEDAPGRFTLARGITGPGGGSRARSLTSRPSPRRWWCADEATAVVAAFDDRQHQGEHGQAVFDQAAGVAAISPDEGEAVVGTGHHGGKSAGIARHLMPTTR